MRRLALAICVVVGMGASAAQATTISFNNSYGPVSVPLSASTLATLPQFDPALGTLTQVTLTLNANASAGSISWDNESQVSTDITLGVGAQVTAVGLAGITAIAVPLQTASAVGISADNDGAADFVGTDAFSVTGGMGNDIGSDVLTAGLSPYIGLGTFGVTVSAIVQTLVSTTGGFGPTQSLPGLTDGQVSVTYQFVAVPEPGTALLFAVGLVSLVAARTRKGRPTL